MTAHKTLIIQHDRLWHRHMDMATLGATPKGGVNRPALSALDAEARKRLIGWAGARGFTAMTDAVGNLFIRRAGREPGLPVVMAGSHLDSQPTGGRFDGTYGVLAAFEVLEALEDAKIETRRGVEAVAWTNEEGARFTPGLMGSGVFSGRFTLQSILGNLDGDGISVADALTEFLASTPNLPNRDGVTPYAYLEAHIEQGPILERAERTIGVVGGIQGARWFEVEYTGSEAHAGTTPLSARRDALAAAIRMLAAMGHHVPDASDTVRFTVGRFQAYPGAPNTVPGRVAFTIDLRHPDAGSLDDYEALIRRVAEDAASPCTVSIRETFNAAPTRFDSKLVDMVRKAATDCELSHMDMVSGALHDAAYLSATCPTAMIFIPCADGISHNEVEAAAPEDVTAGARVLGEVALALADA